MGFLTNNKGSHRASMAQGEHKGASLGEKVSSWWHKAKTIGQKVLKNPIVHGLANMGYDYVKRNHPKYAGAAAWVQNAHNNYYNGQSRAYQGRQGNPARPLKRPAEQAFRQARKPQASGWN